MINPNDVNLIIFDMDGTIIPSLPAVYESIRRAFRKLGWPVTFSAEDINQFFGISVASTKGSLYEFITPPDSHLSVDEVREKVRHEYDGTFRDMAQPYPGVKETLKILRRRGYKLAQYTNASTMYLNLVMSTLDIREYFDYVECIQDNGLAKPQLVRKIREKFGGLTAAVVGDRVHDVEAARATDSLSIGVLFGYGGEEPEKADITINRFDELLSIFDRRLPIFEKIFEAVNKKKQKDRAFVIGINGIDGAGKTKFADSLEKFLISRGHETQSIHLDDFHNPRAFRYAGEDQIENYYSRSFNINLIVKKLLGPIRRNSVFSTSFTLLDWRTDKSDIVKEYSFNPKTIVILEGVFLFRKELSPYIDYKIFLEIPFEESLKRAGTRDSEDILNKYESKYLPAQAKYLEEYPPLKLADMVIDNTDWEFPTIQLKR